MRAFTKATLGGMALVGSAALVLSGCAAPAATPSTGPDAPAGDLTLKIGTALPITGNLAFLGPPEVAGTELAAEDVNAAGAGITGAHPGRLRRHRQQGV